MLNVIWVCLLCSGLLAGFIKGDLAPVTSGILSSTGSAVQTLLSVAGAICFWSGLMKIAEDSGLATVFANLVKPLMKPLFPGLRPGTAAFDYTALNISANVLGVGSAATPLGLKAMEEMAKEHGTDEASDSMCTLVIFNTVGPSLIPTSVVALRASLGSTAPDSIVGPALVVGILATAVSLISDRIIRKRRRARR